MIIMELKLEVIGSDTIIVPGCEPQSALTSDTLARFSTCGKASVKLADALEAIPGSRIEFQINNGESNGARRRWFVLPERELGCPCTDKVDDWYGILKELANEEDEEEFDFSGCGVLDQGFCPPKDFNQIPPPPVSTYKPEGDTLGGTISLFNQPNLFQNPNLVDPIIEA
jgi:hypothetical protein